MHETSKAVMRRLHDSRYATRYFIGNGIDIGAGPDPLGQYGEFFPMMQSCRAWDLPDGDAQYLEGLANDSLDFVHSSHCLEHMVDPAIALKHWLRVLKPGGHLVALVPDEDMYEQGVWPSTWNTDHKWTFTTCKSESWSPRSVNLTDLLPQFRETSYLCKLELMDASFRFMTGGRYDQSMSPVGECAIEFILRKIG
jgi:SAM-dependent methyltransferase